MAASFFSNAIHVDFDSVLAMDEPGMVSMFQALVDSGLQGFLGCSAVVYEEALVEFFANGRVRDGLVVSSVDGIFVEISEKLFAETFELPVDGLGDLSEMPKDAIFYARSIVSLSGEPISLSGRKNQMKMPFRLLCDIVAKAISVKAGSFNAITVEKFSLITVVVCGVKMNWARFLFGVLKKMVSEGSKQAKGFAIQISLLLATFPTVELGESTAFPASKILSKKTVLRFVSINDRDGAEEVARAAKTKAVSKKRPAADVEAAVPKKKRTSKKKSISSISSLDMVAVAEEVVPIQQVAEPLDVEEPRCSSADAVDLIIQQVLDETRAADAPADIDQPAEKNWFDLPYDDLVKQWEAERPVIAQSVVPSVQLSLDQRPSSPISPDSSSSLRFDQTDIDATASSRPPISQDLSAAFADLQANLLEQIFEYQRARQEVRTIDDVHTIRFNEFRKNVLTQNASIFQGLADVRQVVEAVNAKVDIMASRINVIQKDAEATKEALSHRLLEFQSSAQENHNVIHSQLSELVDYIHRGSADKKGESGSRGLQKPANTQKVGSAVTPTFEQRVQMAQRRIVQTVLDVDANRDVAERDRERRRKEAKSLKRRRKD
ncbi:hypothetical protein F511_41676 [Dorcoceras hygrometricum]|uniref:Dystroglycan-like n=1 Tax=Dorcoceras hygrometricum TaxID=472368 RepID=A0A2Z7DFM0_9LAMI|nr:hypothetical protein F511_41676 [Dorcoceras hygrometricum]